MLFPDLDLWHVTCLQVRAHQPPTWQGAADNIENLLVIVFQLWCDDDGACVRSQPAIELPTAVRAASMQRSDGVQEEATLSSMA